MERIEEKSCMKKVEDAELTETEEKIEWSFNIDFVKINFFIL